MTPRVSILMPSRDDRAAMRDEALAAIRAQTRARDCEVIIKIGPSDYYAPEKLNELAAAATGEFVLIHCDDDKLTELAIEVMLRAVDDPYGLGSHTPDVVSCDVQYFGESQAQVRFTNGEWRPPRQVPYEAFANGPCCWISSLIRRSAWNEVRGIDSALHYQDWDLFTRLAQRGAWFAHVPHFAFCYRQHAGQASNVLDARLARAQFFAKHPTLIDPLLGRI